MQLLYRGVCRGFVEYCVPKMALSVQYNSAVSDSSLSWLYFNKELYLIRLFNNLNKNKIKYKLDISCFSLFVFPVFLASLETHSLCPEISEQPSRYEYCNVSTNQKPVLPVPVRTPEQIIPIVHQYLLVPGHLGQGHNCPHPPPPGVSHHSEPAVRVEGVVHLVTKRC